MPNNHAQFYRKLGDLLEEYGVEIDSHIDEEPMVRVEFADPYACHWTVILDADECRELEREINGDS